MTVGVIEVGARGVTMEGTVYVVVRFAPIALSVLVLALVSVLVPCGEPSVVAMMAVRCVLALPVLAAVGIKLGAVSVPFSAGSVVACTRGIRHQHPTCHACATYIHVVKHSPWAASAQRTNARAALNTRMSKLAKVPKEGVWSTA